VRPAEQLPADFAAAFAAVEDRLSPLGRRVVFFETVGSTNDAALGLASEPDAEGTIVIAGAQTAGRGRYGRTWFSPPESGLYVSVVLRPGAARREPDRAVGLLTLAAGVALAEGIEALTRLRVDIKWPNDLMIRSRKLAGILAETARSDGSTVVLGYGINVGANTFPSELGDRPTSIAAELGRPMDRASLCAETIAALARRYEDLLTGRFDAILDSWRRRAPTSRGALVTWSAPAGRLHGITAGIDDRGALIIQTAHRTERIVGGELNWD